MAITYTTRLQLAKPDADEFQLVSVIDSNYDLIDKYVDARIVADNVTPALNELYDGAIVHEKVSGRTWIAVANLAGAFDKHYISGMTQFWSIPVTGLSNTYLAPGANLGWSSGFSRGTTDYNRYFMVNWALLITGSDSTSTVIQAEIWLNGAVKLADRHAAIPGTFGQSGPIVVPAGTPTGFQGIISSVVGPGVHLDATSGSQFSWLQLTETAIP